MTHQISNNKNLLNFANKIRTNLLIFSNNEILKILKSKYMLINSYSPEYIFNKHCGDFEVRIPYQTISSSSDLNTIYEDEDKNEKKSSKNINIYDHYYEHRKSTDVADEKMNMEVLKYIIELKKKKMKIAQGKLKLQQLCERTKKSLKKKKIDEKNKVKHAALLLRNIANNLINYKKVYHINKKSDKINGHQSMTPKFSILRRKSPQKSMKKLIREKTNYLSGFRLNDLSDITTDISGYDGNKKLAPEILNLSLEKRKKCSFKEDLIEYHTAIKHNTVNLRKIKSVQNIKFQFNNKINDEIEQKEKEDYMKLTKEITNEESSDFE